MPFKLIPEPTKELPSKKDSIAHGAAVSATGSLAALPGSIGNVAKFFNDIIAAPLTKAITGKNPPSYEESTFGKILPTTEQHIKTLEENIPYLKPRNKFEKFSQDIFKDATELFLPGRYFKMGRYAFSPLRSLGISVGANLTGEATEQFTGDKKKGELAKSGAMLALSLLNPISAKNISQNLYQEASRILPSNAEVSAVPFIQRLDQLQNRITGTRPIQNLAPSERFVYDQIQNFRNLINNNRISIPSLVQQNRSFNEELQRNLFNIPDRALRARARELSTNISHAARETMQDYGHVNPQWWHLQSEANRAHSAIAQSNFISRQLERFMKGRPDALAHLFGVGIPAGAAFISPVGAGTATAGYMATKLIMRTMRSPALRNHYAKIIRAALANNPKEINKQLDEMQKKIEKEKKPKFRLIAQ